MIRTTLLGAAALTLALAPQALATSYVVDAQPILSAKCGACHTTGSSGGHSVGASYDDSQGGATKCDDSNIAECSVARIEDGTMPLGKGCDGVVADDAENADVCVTVSELAVLRDWLAAGTPEEDSGEQWPECTSDEDCADDLVCSTDGACVEDGGSGFYCGTDDECNEGEVCIDGGCVEDGGDVQPECVEDIDCGDMAFCIEGACQPGGEIVCETDDDCDDGYTCLETSCVEGAWLGRQGSVCTTDDDCDDGMTCMMTGCVGLHDAGACDANDQCGDGAVCTDGACVAGGASDGGGCQTGGGPLGGLTLLLAVVALLGRRRSLFSA